MERKLKVHHLKHGQSIQAVRTADRMSVKRLEPVVPHSLGRGYRYSGVGFLLTICPRSFFPWLFVVPPPPPTIISSSTIEAISFFLHRNIWVSSSMIRVSTTHQGRNSVHPHCSCQLHMWQLLHSVGHWSFGSPLLKIRQNVIKGSVFKFV